jgi:hypothetical protein
MKSTGHRIFLTAVSLVLVMGVFGAFAQTKKPTDVAPSGSDSTFLIKKSDDGRPQPAAAAGTSVPVAAQPGISGVLGHDDSRYQVQAMHEGFRAENPQQTLTTEFTVQGLEVSSGTARWGLTLRGYGYGDALQAATPATPQGSANRVEYRRGALTEWYLNGPLGMEQGFTLRERPGRRHGEPLAIALELSKDLSVSLDPGSKGLTLTKRDGQAKLRYTGLVAYDATGKELRSWLEARGADLLLRVEDAQARYPVVVDPVIQAAKLTASDGTLGDIFGVSVGISSDGRTLLVGAPGATTGLNNRGAVYVFEKPSSGWATTARFAAKLTAWDGVANDNFGSSVAISGDGATVVAGAPEDTINSFTQPAAAYVFVKPSGGWVTTSVFNAKLTASDWVQGDEFGYSVAASNDGGTVVAGAYFASTGSNTSFGAAYVFAGPASGWATSTESAKLTSSDGGEFGTSVGINGGGSTVVVGAPATTVGSNSSQGATYVFLEPPSGWATTTETAKLTASDGAADNQFGISVVLSGDGGTLVGGAFNAQVGSNTDQGAAYVFVKPPSGWATTTETAKLTASDGLAHDWFGWSVATSGDGGRAVVGAFFAPDNGPNSEEGAAYVFVRPTAGWVSATETTKLLASDGTTGYRFAISTAVSGDGATVVAGAPYAQDTNGGQGAVYVFGSEGSGVPAASLSMTSLSFGNQDMGTTSPAQTVTLTNTGNAPLQVTGVTTFVPFVGSSGFATTTNCVAASPLQPKESCTESVTFKPSAAGPANGTLTFTDNSGDVVGGHQTVSLSGAGVDFVVSAAPASQSVLPGHSVKYAITLVPLGGFSGTVRMGCSGGPRGTTYGLSASSVTLNGAVTITATVTVPHNAKKGTWTLRFAGTSGPLVHSASVKLAVN